METKFIEATNGPQNWGKFMIGRFTAEERARPSVVNDGQNLFRSIGRACHGLDLLVLDLQTGEGAIFYCWSHANAKADLNKHQIWVCSMFEPFLTWLYKQNLADLSALPSHVDFDPKDAPFDWAGYRRAGPNAAPVAETAPKPRQNRAKGKVR